ncbi:hypothetical protein Pelo_19896 [Pelomyxa schiedti]|nr:hypothetical protein Pelo_19896 [Pelomyxa schiedti]
MGRGHAAWLVRSLWSDLVRPTLRTFLLDVGTRYYVAGRLAVTISPVLLSVAPGGPRRVPGHPGGSARDYGISRGAGGQDAKGLGLQECGVWTRMGRHGFDYVP